MPVFAETAPAPTAAKSTDANEVSFNLAAYRIHNGYNPGFWLGTSGGGIGYARRLTSLLDLSMHFALDDFGNTVSVPGATVIRATIGTTFNFPVDDRAKRNAYFITLEAGIDYSSVNSLAIPGTDYTTGGMSSSNLAYNLQLGKRFELLPNISLRPLLAISGHTGVDILSGGGTSYPDVEIVPLALSIFF
jgi:hypothetical protein